jgi:predicted DNA-binding transcriptional regulator AlpA
MNAVVLPTDTERFDPHEFYAQLAALADDFKKFLKTCLKEIQSASEPNDLLTIEEVAAMFKMDERTIRRHVATGEFAKPVRVGRSVRWRRCDLNRLW